MYLKSPDKHLEDFFEKSAIFSTFLDFILKIWSNIGGKSSASLSELHYRCQGEHFEKEQLFWTKSTCFFWLLLDFQSIFLFGNSTKTFQHSCTNCISRIQKNSLSRKFFLEKKKHFSIDVRKLVTKKLGVLAKTRQQGCQNCILCVQGMALRFFLNKTHFFSSLAEYEQKDIKLLAEISRQACLKCNLDVGGIILRKKFFWIKCSMFLCIVFGLPAQFF